jgi:cation diffusion facilitator family transporter
VLFAAKVVAYLLTNSLAILTDALESIVNVVAGVIGLYSLYVAAKPSDEDHPYGHGKAEFVSAAVEGTLIVAGGILIVYETIKNIIAPTPLGKLDLGLVLVAITQLSITSRELSLPTSVKRTGRFRYKPQGSI